MILHAGTGQTTCIRETKISPFLSLRRVLVDDKRILGLFKFGDRKHIDELLFQGRVFMNPLSYYINREVADDARSDKTKQRPC